MALVVTGHPAALTIRGLVASDRPDVALLVRFLTRRGDGDPGVLAEAFAGLLGFGADDTVPFVAERLASDNRDIARAAGHGPRGLPPTGGGRRAP